jgi:lysophospholipase L1-like esterase
VSAQFSAREVAGFFVTLVGLALLASAALVNPWVLPMAIGSALASNADVLLGYLITAAGLGFLVALLGALMSSGRAPRLDGAVVLVLIAALLVAADRLLLAFLGLPLWTHDPELAYRNRPHKVASLVDRGRPGAWVRINGYGHHDPEDFPVAKPPGEFRALMLGDSITMGDGVPADEAFPEQLEDLLDARDTRFRSHRVINTAVHGYSTFQELRMLEESLRFEPDFAALGFCMNDVTEPFVNNQRYGGVALDYHGVWQTPSPFLGWLLTDTGVGRLLQKLRARSASREAAVRLESYDVRKLADEGTANPRYREAWDIVLADLDRAHRIAAEHELPFALLIFPFVFQLADPATRGPQAILAEFAAERGIPVIDFTEIFARHVYADADLVDFLRRRGTPVADPERMFEWRVRELFLDSDHLTAAGHRIAAEALAGHLEQADIIGSGPRPR